MCLLNSFVPFQNQIKVILIVAGFPDPPLLFSSMEVRLNGCLTTCHPERLLRKAINCSISHGFALLMLTLMR